MIIKNIKTSTGNSNKIVIEDDIGKVISSALVRMNPTKQWMKVSRVRTKKQYRQQGYATLVIKAVIQYFGNYELRLNPYPDGTNGLDYEQLRVFYRKFGFQDVEGQKRMVRPAEQY